MQPPVRDLKASRRALPLAGLAALYVVATVLYAVLGHAVKVPVLFPDEFHYGHIARSIADGDGATWNGAPERVRSLLYLYLVAPSWIVASGTDAYAVAKIVTAAMCCLVVVPVWLLAGELVGRRLALVPAALTLAGAWMAGSGLILTDNLAFPLGVAALCAMVMALRAPASRWWLAAVVLTGLAGFARLQVAVLLPIFFAALLLDALRYGRGELRPRLEAHRFALLVTGIGSAAGLLVVLASGGSALGIYSSIQDFRPGLGKVLAATAQQLLAFVVMAGAIPVALALAMMLRPANWRDERSGPVLAVLICATLGFALQSGWFVAGFHARWDIERYMIYALPLALVAMMLAPGRVSWRTGLAAIAAIAVPLLAMQEVQSQLEQRALLAATRRLGGLIGTFADHPGLGLMVAAVLLGIAALAVVVRGGHDAAPDRALLGLGALVLVVLVVQSQAAWRDQIRFSDHQRAQQPADLEWVDHAARGAEVGILNTSSDNRAFHVTQFLNESIRGSFDATNGQGRTPLGPECALQTAEDGTLRGSGCAPPRTLLIENTVTRPRLYRETVLADHGPRGRLVRYGGAPRLLAVVADPCLEPGEPFQFADDPERPCRGEVAATLWLDRPGVVTFRFLGGSAQHFGRLNGQVTEFPPGAARSASAEVAAGASTTAMELDWQTTAGAPVLSGVDVQLEGGRRIPVGGNPDGREAAFRLPIARNARLHGRSGRA